MDLHGAGSGEGGGGDAIALAEIIVLPAHPDELAAHDDLLKGLDKEAKGACLWRQLAEN